MANNYRDISATELKDMADSYCDYCIESTKEVPTVKGPVQIKERHLPTVSYFLLHWLRRQHFEFYQRTNWYDAMKNEEHPLSNTIKSIDNQFKALAEDIVANEGKGIFYAKNRLGMTDKVDSKTDNTNKITVEYVSQASTTPPEPTEGN